MRLPWNPHAYHEPMKTLITGGAGFIGSHLADGLIARGDEVTIFDNLSSGREENLAGALDEGANLVLGDINDYPALEASVADSRPDVIFHLAAQGEVRKSIEEPVFDAASNVVGTVNVLEAARRFSTKRVVFASTGGAIYGEGSRIELPADESALLAPLCPYGQSKLAAEGYLDLYRRMYGLSSAALRFANVYGPRQNPKGEAGAVAIFGDLLMRGERPTIFGDGTQTRDFIYIDDLIEGVLAASTASVEGPVNLGSGEETSLVELLQILAEATSALNRESPVETIEPIFGEPRPGEVKRICISPDRAREFLDWSPKVLIEDGLLRTLRTL